MRSSIRSTGASKYSSCPSARTARGVLRDHVQLKGAPIRARSPQGIAPPTGRGLRAFQLLIDDPGYSLRAVPPASTKLSTWVCAQPVMLSYAKQCACPLWPRARSTVAALPSTTPRGRTSPLSRATDRLPSILQLKADAIRDARSLRVRARLLDPIGLNVHAVTARAAPLRGRNGNASIAQPQS